MPSNVAVPYMNAWVMMLTLASRIGTYALRSSDQVVERARLRGVVRGGCRRVRRFSVSMRSAPAQARRERRDDGRTVGRV